MKQKKGMAGEAWRGYIRACFAAKIDPDRITQTLGNAAASAGAHKKDGEIDGKPYCAATDISIRGLERSQIKTLLNELAKQGFAGWFRDWDGNEHCHVIYCGLPMKPMLDAQIHDWLSGKDGLSGHAKSEFVVATEWAKQHVRTMFQHSNPGD